MAAMMYWIALLAAASTALAKASTTTSFELCKTEYASTSYSTVRTVNSLSTATSVAVLTTTSTPTFTSTAAAKTSTSVVTDTVSATTILDQSTSTFSTTITSTITLTVQDIVTDTETVTSDTTITSTPTSTVPAPAGFTPASALSQSSATIQGVKQTALVKANGASTPQAITIHAAQSTAIVEAEPSYASVVTCVGLVEILSTSTVNKPATQTHTVVVTPSAKTTTSTAHITTTITLVPVPASTTLTFTTNFLKSTAIVTTTTSTETTTNTATVQAPAQTQYAACGPDNQITTVNGRSITEVVVTGNYETNSASTPYDCCVACIDHSTPCAGYLSAEGAGCYLLLPGGTNNATCSPSNRDTASVDLGNGVGGFTVGNSGCGSFRVREIS
ncbi:uncharacterized protein BO66DRAFT_434135 [Aspergillus aculeatinus CBS 121060]|uniref:Uncharacterized protein n=1 Tax=Aspergillus aculeatinus CBS 121060 TaxID=1448322 RepID=A0ACD1HN45_9EURO|nr:hypothetical protein BO66DRAFT_434135 [Aspergillus aculeatinus CBS 121060]RAH75033.1 hypothetical protein BO66DRAFT_434135 [Aspergillus aculeatinus CBS 121060]